MLQGLIHPLALLAPFLAVDRKHASANQRLQQPQGEGMFGVGLGFIDHHPPGFFGISQQQHGAAEHTLAADGQAIAQGREPVEPGAEPLQSN